tara:strand:+ start:20 stop:436 length:417 start_codon:yes stop_codon:yes gene_type:complete
MNLEGILSISGKSGLYKLVSQAKNTLIVEGLTDSKRFPLYASHQVNALEDIGIYTYDNTVALSDVFSAIAKKENGSATISHKVSKSELYDWLREVLPDFDEDRVYQSDIKKLVQWYNTLHTAGLVELKKEEKDGSKDS